VKHRLPGGRALTRLFAAACAAGAASMLFMPAHRRKTASGRLSATRRALYRIPVLGAIPAPGSPNGKLSGVFVLTTSCGGSAVRRTARCNISAISSARTPCRSRSFRIGKPGAVPVGRNIPMDSPVRRCARGSRHRPAHIPQSGEPAQLPNTLTRRQCQRVRSILLRLPPAERHVPDCFTIEHRKHPFSRTHVNPPRPGIMSSCNPPSPRADNKPIVTARASRIVHQVFHRLRSPA